MNSWCTRTRCGPILAIEEQEIAGARLELFVINFVKDKMTLRVPAAKVANVGMRKLSEPVAGEEGPRDPERPYPGEARHVVAPRRGLRSQDQFRRHRRDRGGDARPLPSDWRPEQSYSERQLYEAALDRLSREIAVVQHSTETEAIEEVEASSPRARAAASRPKAAPKVKAKQRVKATRPMRPPATIPRSPTRPPERVSRKSVQTRHSKARSQEQDSFV